MRLLCYQTASAMTQTEYYVQKSQENDENREGINCQDRTLYLLFRSLSLLPNAPSLPTYLE